MSDDVLDRLCRHFGLDVQIARGVAIGPAGDDAPWYLRAASAIGAWLTAAAMIAAVALNLVEAFDGENLPLTAAGSGAVIAAAAVALHRASRGEFANQCAVAAALAGQALVVGGLGIEFEAMTVAAAGACVVAALLTAAIRDPELQFLSSALAVAAVLAALLERNVPQAGGILVVVTLPPALGLLLRPLARLDLRGLAWALLLVPLGALSLPEIGGLNTDWLPRAVYAAGLLAVLVLLWRRTTAGRRPMVAAAAAVAILLGAITAAGIAGSLLLLTLAYLLGSRMLAIIGAVAHVWFVSRFYYDLDLTLLEKSGMLTAAGLLLLALWWAWTRSAEAEAGDG